MAKHFIMGDGELTDEERETLKKAREEAEQKNKEYNELQKKLQVDKKTVTLEELLKTRLDPQEDRIVVWRDKADEFTEGGLIKPKEALDKERPSRGTVIAVGPGKDNANLTQELLCAILEAADGRSDAVLEFENRIKTIAINYKPGDRIMFGRFAGTPVEDPDTGEELLIMRPSDIFVKL